MPHSASPVTDLVRKGLRLVLDRAPRNLMAALLLVAVVINFANVIGRYVFQSAIFWTDEILVFLIIWCVFIGIVAVAYNGAHLKMDLVSARSRGPARLLINGAAALGIVICSVVMVWQSTQVVLLLASTGQVSVTASIPMTLVHMAIPLGFALMALAVLVRVHAYLTDDFE
jgi:TRAP-type C4-dicarboxylate transport system permease small subunit